MTVSGKEPPEDEPLPPDFEDAEGVDPTVSSNDAKKVLDSDAWTPTGEPLPCPEDGEDPAEVPEGHILVLSSDNAREGVRDHPRHVAESNEDGSFDSKSDTSAVNSNASFEEAFGPTKELMEERGDTNIVLRIYSKVETELPSGDSIEDDR